MSPVHRPSLETTVAKGERKTEMSPNVTAARTIGYHMTPVTAVGSSWTVLDVVVNMLSISPSTQAIKPEAKIEIKWKCGDKDTRILASGIEFLASCANKATMTSIIVGNKLP
jgi:hypothetical protein